MLFGRLSSFEQEKNLSSTRDFNSSMLSGKLISSEQRIRLSLARHFNLLVDFVINVALNSD